MNKNVIIAYVDGSWSSKNPDISGYGVVITDVNNNVIYVDKGYITGDATVMRQVAGEVESVVRAVDYAIKNKYSKIVIKYDYEGVRSWVTGDWETRNEWTRRYSEWMDDAKKKVLIKFEKIESKDNVADIMARAYTKAGDVHNSESKLKKEFDLR